MQTKKNILIVAATCLAAIGAQAADSSSEEIEQGRALYNDFGCYQCHGHYGQGGNSGPKLAPGPLPYEAFKIIVRRPVAKMPPYTDKVLSDEQLNTIHAYLESLEKTPPADEVDLLDLTIQPQED